MAVLEHFESDLFSLSHSIDKEPKSDWFQLHIHDNYELFCLVKGKVGYIVEGHRYKLRPGSVLLIRSSELHRLLVNESYEYERYVINFSPDLFLKKGFDKSILKPYINRELGKKNLYSAKELEPLSAIACFEKMISEAKVINPEDAIFANLSSLISFINVLFLNKKEEEQEENSIISYINENLTTNISVSDVAAFAHLSTSQLSRVFKELSGTSVYEYILSKRLILFQEKIKQGKNAIKASSECGFGDYSSFYRLYKKRFGVPPTKKSQEA
ncbi:MAG: helix-turn-helix domain-containing protein [Clostridia bacterium]|nr:helix-turn-helix domain-containing protein [Clostridia bacterium]